MYKPRFEIDIYLLFNLNQCVISNNSNDLFGTKPALYFVGFYTTLHYKLFIVAKVKNCKVHYGASHTTMSGYDCRNKRVFSF